jgi:hypothetical protein
VIGYWRTGNVRRFWFGPLGVRVGVEPHPLFSERNQGTHGIPRRFLHLFGGRLTLIKRSRVRVADLKPSGSTTEVD